MMWIFDTCRNAVAGRLLVLCLFFVTYGLGADVSRANPTGQNVVAGQANFATSGTTLTITNTDKAIIQWQDFSIQSGELTKFIQSSSASSVLNRVVGGNLSSIYGTLQSNGQVFLVNPNGILIGASGVVDTAGFTASTLDVANQEFVAGAGMKYVGVSEQSVTNLGKIEAGVGDVMLISQHIINAGTIRAPNGTVGLYGTDSLYLAEGTGERGIVRVSLEAQSATGNGVENSGLIESARAEIKATGNLYALAINNTGTIRATGTQNLNGVIHFIGLGGMVKNQGTLAASDQNGQGGFIETSGHDVDLGGVIDTGLGGTWLIDPYDLSITAPLAATVVTSLNGGSNVVLQADNNIVVNSNIVSSGSGRLTLYSDYDNDGNGTISFGLNNQISRSGGSGDVDFYYNPSAFNNPTNFSTNVTMGSGTFTPWMLVHTVTDLQSMNTNRGGNYALGGAIDASATSGWNSGAGFVPIGDSGTAFSGKLNGQNHRILNLTINRPTTDYVGLFGYLGSGGLVRNVGLANATITGNNETGGIVGYSVGSNLIKTYVEGLITGNQSVGGVAGYFSMGSLTQSYSSATVSSPIGQSAIGGLVGFDIDGGTVSQCYATGTVSAPGAINYVGGLIGYLNNSSVSQTYSTGLVSATPGQGLIGVNFAATVNNSFWDTTTSGKATSAGGGTGYATAAMQTQSTFTGAGWSFSAGAGNWVMINGTTYPELEGLSISVSGTALNNSSVGLSSTSLIGLFNGMTNYTATTNASGAYQFLVQGTGNLLIYSPGNVTGNAVIHDTGVPLTGINLVYGMVNDYGVLSNSRMALALGSVSNTGILYSYSGKDITLTSGIGLNVNDNFTINGNITASSLSFNAPVFTGPSSTSVIATSGNLSIGSSSNVVYGSKGDLSLRATGDVLLQGDIRMTGGNVTLLADTDSTGGGRVFINSNITTNGGDILASGVGDASNNNGINVNGTTVDSGGGNITFYGTGMTSGPAGSNGIQISGSLYSGNGSISLTGTGAPSSVNSTNHGINLSGANIVATGGGQITLVGQAGVLGASHGVSVVNSLIQSVNGSISITGTGSTGTGNQAVVIVGSNIAASGTGNLLIAGTAVSASGIDNYGVELSNGGATGATNITTNSGNLTITGTAATGGSNRYGIAVYTSYNAQPVNIATSSGNLTLNGTGGDNDIYLSGGSGAFNLNGGSGNLTLKADTLTMSSLSSSALAGTGKLIFAPNNTTASLTVGSGAIDTANIANGFSNIIIGSATLTGSVNVAASSFQDNVTIQAGGAGGNVNITGALSTGSGTSNGTITLAAGQNINLGSTITTQGSNINLNGNIALTSTSSVNSTGGNINANYTINGAQVLSLNAGTGNLVLNGAVGTTTALSGLYLTQGGTFNNTNPFKTSNLLLLGSGSYVLSNVTNAIGTLAANLSGAGAGITVADAAGSSMTVGTVNAVNGITTNNGAVTLNSNASASSLTVSQNITTAGGAVTLYGYGTAVRGIQVTQGINAGGGNIYLQGNSSSNIGLSLNGGGPASAVTSGTGSITLVGTSATAGGIDINAATLVNVTGSGTLTLTSTGDLNTDNGSVLSTNTGSLSINSLGGNYSMTNGGGGIGSLISYGAGNITITSNQVFLNNASIQSSGTLWIRPQTSTTTIGLGNGATGTLNLNNTALGFLQAGFSNIIIGNTTQTGSIDVGNSSWTSNVIFQGPVVLPGTRTVTTSNKNILFTGTVDGTTAGAQDLTLTAGTGKIGFNGAVGGVTALGNLTASGGGAWALSQNITVTNSLSLNTTASLTGAGLLSAPQLTLIGGTGVNLSNLNATNISASTTSNTDIVLTNANAAATTISSLGTSGGNISFTQSGGGGLTVAGNVSSGVGNVTGGNIAISNSGALTVNSGVSIASPTGNTGTFNNFGASITGATITVAGGKTITLTGGGLDIYVLNSTISASAINYSAIRDVVISNTTQTTNAGSPDITLIGDSDNDGVGGVWVKSTGSVNSIGNVTIKGANLYADNVAGVLQGHSIRIDGSVVASKDLTLQKTTAVTTAATIQVNALLQAGGNLTVTSTGSDFTDSSQILVTGAVNLNSSGNNVTLSNSTNQFGTISVQALNASISTANAASLSGATVTGTLNLKANGSISQSGAINVNTLSLDNANSTGSSIILINTSNKISNISGIARGGNVSIFEDPGLTISGSINTGNLNSSVSIQTVGGDLTLASGVILASSGVGNDLTLSTSNNLVNNAGSNALQATGGARWVVYDTDPKRDTLGGLTGSQDYGKTYPSTPSFAGNGFVSSVSAPAPIVQPPILPPIVPVLPLPTPGKDQPFIPIDVVVNFDPDQKQPPHIIDVILTDSLDKGNEDILKHLIDDQSHKREATLGGGETQAIGGGDKNPQAVAKLDDSTTDEVATVMLQMMLGGVNYEQFVIKPDGFMQIDQKYGVLPAKFNQVPAGLTEAVTDLAETDLIRLLAEQDSVKPGPSTTASR